MAASPLSAAFGATFEGLHRGRFLVLLVWLGVAAVGGLRASHLFDNLQDDLQAPGGSQAHRANQVLSYTGFLDPNWLMVSVELEAGDGKLFDARHGNRSREVTAAVYDNLAQSWFSCVMLSYERARASNCVDLDGAYCAAQEPSLQPECGVDYARDESQFGPIMPRLLSDDGRTTLILMGPDAGWILKDGLDAMLDGMRESGALDGYRVGATGIHALRDADGDAKSELAKGDLISIPIALLMLAWRVGSLPLMLVPLLVLPMSLLTAVAMLAQASDDVNFPNFSPALFTSVTVAMAFDWSLFLLTRYQRARRGGADNTAAVRDALANAGHTIVLSGVTLVVSYVSLLLFPVGFISSVGKGGALTLLACMMVNLTLTPALLLTFPCLGNPRFTCFGRAGRAGAADGAGAGAAAGVALLDKDAASQEDADLRRSPWFRLAEAISRRPLAVVVTLVALFSPLTYYATQMRLQINRNQLHPTNKEVYKVWHRTNEAMGTGTVYPYSLVALAGKGAQSVDQYFEVTNRALGRVVNRTALEPLDVTGPTYLFGGPLTTARTAELAAANTTEGQLFRGVNQTQAREGEGLRGTVTQLAVPFDPQGPDAQGFISAVREVVADENKKQDAVVFSLGNGLSATYDVRDAVFERFPTVVGLTIAIVLLVMSLGMRSLMLAARMALSVGLTLSWTYGAGVVVFQTSAFDGLSDRLADIDALYWMAPPLTFSLVFGLACDYDVFLSGRVRELRAAGHTDHAAVVLAVAQTGPTITVAGMIMAVAFGVLMTSSQMLLVQAGFFLGFGTVLDTFVVRMLLVPAMMFLIGPRNWWPTRMPPGTKDELGRDASADALADSATAYEGFGAPSSL